MRRPAPTQAPGPLFTEQVSVPERTVQEHTRASQVDRISTNQASGRGTSVSPLGWPRVPLPEQRCGDMGYILFGVGGLVTFRTVTVWWLTGMQFVEQRQV